MYSWIEMPDGFTLPGPHAVSVAADAAGQTISSIYLLECQNELGLIDTGMRPYGGEAIEEKIDELGGNLKWIALTHFHYDHIGNAAQLREKYKCPVLAHPADIPAIENPRSTMDGSWVLPDYGVTLEEMQKELDLPMPKSEDIEHFMTPRNFPVKVDREINHGDVLSLGCWRIKCLNTPGHSPGSMSFYNPASGSAYVGDLEYGSNPSRAWPVGSAQGLEKGLKRIIRLSPSFLGLGHGNGIYGQFAIKDYLQAMLDRHYSIDKRIKVCLERTQPVSIANLAEEVFPIIERYSWFPIPRNTVQCFLHDMLEEGIVHRNETESGVFWNLAE